MAWSSVFLLFLCLIDDGLNCHFLEMRSYHRLIGMTEEAVSSRLGQRTARVFDEMVSRNAFRCFAKQKGSFRPFRCFAKQAVSAKRVSRNTETVILFREKLNKKRCEVNQSFPILHYFAKFSVFHCFAKRFGKRFAKQKGSYRLFRCFAKQAVSANRVSRNTETIILFREN